MEIPSKRCYPVFRISTWNLVCPLFWGLNPPTKRPFPIKTRVIWVPGLHRNGIPWGSLIFHQRYHRVPLRPLRDNRPGSEGSPAGNFPRSPRFCGNTYRNTEVFAWKILPWKLTNVPWKPMVGRCIPYWNSSFLGDMLVFRGVFLSHGKGKSSSNLFLDVFQSWVLKGLCCIGLVVTRISSEEVFLDVCSYIIDEKMLRD